MGASTPRPPESRRFLQDQKQSPLYSDYNQEILPESARLSSCLLFLWPLAKSSLCPKPWKWPFVSWRQPGYRFRVRLKKRRYIEEVSIYNTLLLDFCQGRPN